MENNHEIIQVNSLGQAIDELIASLTSTSGVRKTDQNTMYKITALAVTAILMLSACGASPTVESTFRERITPGYEGQARARAEYCKNLVLRAKESGDSSAAAEFLVEGVSDIAQGSDISAESALSYLTSELMSPSMTLRDAEEMFVNCINKAGRNGQLWHAWFERKVVH